MNVTLTEQDLIAFEEDIVKCFEEKMILAPIHLDNGNEKQLIEVFKKYVDEDDWICGSWRTHYKCLLKGVPPAKVKESILDGKSISLCFPEYKVISSAIVSGILPIGVGIAMSIKRNNKKNKVVCFLGEMTSETGVAHECIKYSRQHELPIVFVIEDNGKSVCTDTRETWNVSTLSYEMEELVLKDKVVYFKYKSKFPHAGGLKRVQF